MKFMQFLKQIALNLRLVERYESFDERRSVSKDDFIIPDGVEIEGEIRVNRNVVVVGQVSGSLHACGSERTRIIVVPGAKVSDGTISAHDIEIGCVARNVSINGDRIYVSGAIDGRSEILYRSLSKDDEAPINGRLQRRTIPFDVSKETLPSVAQRRQILPARELREVSRNSI